MEKGGWVYVMANRYRGGMYVGVTANIDRRVYQHKHGMGSVHVTERGKTMLVYAERHEEIEAAIAREKLVKRWKREWKFALIEKDNPEWRDLWDEWFPMEAAQGQPSPASSAGRRERELFTRTLNAAGLESIAEAARFIAAGQCVGVPTETVYGLAADATQPHAVAGIYAAKGRPGFNPLIVHVPDLAAAERHAVFNDAARDLAARHWPGPLTLVLPLRPESGIASLVTAGLLTIALRVPAHPAMQALLAACRKPLAAPSANASGSISPTRAEHVLKSLDGRIPLILDGGPTAVGLESTIVAVAADGSLRLLRPGPVDLGLELAHGGNIEAPGQLASHYAPAKPLRLNAMHAEPDEWLIGFGTVRGDATLSANGDLTQAAARLFDALHVADASPRARIAMAPVPEMGLGLAINDRLRRAAA